MKVAWNKGLRRSKSDQQHVFIPEEDLELWLAVLLYFTGPVYTAAIWICMLTSRRISEALRLRGSDLFLAGGLHCDQPHVLFKGRKEDGKHPGFGKIGATEAIARVSEETVKTPQKLQQEGLPWKSLLALQTKAELKRGAVFDKFKPASMKQTFQIPADDSLLFPTTRRKSQLPWMTRQSASWICVTQQNIF